MSSSALSTATSLGALAFVARQSSAPHPRTAELVEAGLKWLADNVNEDGGWGDTDLSFSNISTTTLCWAAFAMAGADGRYPEIVKGAEAWLTKAAGGIEPEKLAPAIIRRYGKDKTFSVPILTMCVISGRLGTGRAAWKWVRQLPFELAAFPHKFFAALRLPVVSYALPALIAIGNARHARRPSWNPLTRWFRSLVRDRTLEKLKKIQPESGGFLEASPLTSFVAMSLAAAGQVGHPVTRKCVEFLVGNAREDGSWPIDTNLATWVTTLAINALANDPEFAFKEAEFGRVRDWLLDQQYKDVHPYTNAAPGGWAWTDLSGGVPDADDTAGAILALEALDGTNPSRKLEADAVIQIIEEKKWKSAGEFLDLVVKAKQQALIGYYSSSETSEAPTLRIQCDRARDWLSSLQNRDGGIPTFCRGWTNLPFDRSSPDISAHALRTNLLNPSISSKEGVIESNHRERAVPVKLLSYLHRQQNADGSWTPLWFGNQHDPNEENRLYGTAKVVLAMPLPAVEEPWQALEAGVRWLIRFQQPDGGWNGGAAGPSSVEETALAVEALAACCLGAEEGQWREISSVDLRLAMEHGVLWLLEKIESGEWTQPSPIGFYFAKLWYYEKLYPIIFTVAALNKVKAVVAKLESHAKMADPDNPQGT